MSRLRMFVLGLDAMGAAFAMRLGEPKAGWMMVAAGAIIAIVEVLS